MNSENLKNNEVDGKEIKATNPLLASEMSSEQNYNMIDGIPNNTAPELTQVETRSAVLSSYEELSELTAKGGAVPFKDFIEKRDNTKPPIHNRKFDNVDIIDFLSAVVAKNTLNYQTDFEYDKVSFIKAAESPDMEDRRFLWLSRPSGTECFAERETFIRGTAAFNSWTYYEGRNDELVTFAVEITGMENGHPVGNLFELNHEQHVQMVKQEAMLPHSVLVTFASGEEKQFSFEEYSKNFQGLQNIHGKILDCKIEVKDETTLQSLLSYQRDSRNRFPVRSFNAFIKNLPTREKPSVTEKLNEAKKAVKFPSAGKIQKDKHRPER